MHGVYYLHQQTMSHKDCILRLSACTINHCHSGDCSPHDHISTSIKFAENNMLYMFVPHLIRGAVQLQSSQMASLLNTSSSCQYNSKQQAELHRSRPNRYMLRHRFKSKPAIFDFKWQQLLLQVLGHLPLLSSWVDCHQRKYCKSEK